MAFQNLALEIEDLPGVDEPAYKELHPNYLQVTMLSRIFQMVVILGLMITGLSFGGVLFDLQIFLSSLGGWALLVGLSLTLTWIGFRYKAYAIRQRDVHYKTGYIWRSEVSIPFHRVQHAEVSQGILERMFELSSLKVYTAGGESSDLNIPGLTPEKARSLKAFILKNSDLDQEEIDKKLEENEGKLGEETPEEVEESKAAAEGEEGKNG